MSGMGGGLTYDPVADLPLKGKKVKTRICTLSHAWNLELVDIFSLTNIFRVQCSQTVHSKYIWLYHVIPLNMNISAPSTRGELTSL